MFPYIITGNICFDSFSTVKYVLFRITYCIMIIQAPYALTFSKLHRRATILENYLHKKTCFNPFRVRVNNSHEKVCPCL